MASGLLAGFLNSPPSFGSPGGGVSPPGFSSSSAAVTGPVTATQSSPFTVIGGGKSSAAIIAFAIGAAAAFVIFKLGR